jgi:hypothetical protein
MEKFISTVLRGLGRSNAPWLPDQLLEAKLGFIKDMERGTVQREADDIGDDVVSYAAIKAMSSGNPKLLKKVELDSQMLKLDALRREWLSARSSMMLGKDWKLKRVPRLEAEQRELEAAITERDASEKKGFSATISGTVITEREAAGKAIRRAAQMEQEYAKVGMYRGLPLMGAVKMTAQGAELLPEMFIGVLLPDGKILNANSETTDKGLFASIDAILRSLDEKLELAREAVANTKSDIESIETESVKPWQYEDEFSRLASELAALNAELTQATREKKDDDGEAAPEEDIDLSVVDNDDGWLEVFESALARIDAMHQQPIEVELPEPSIPVTPESIEHVRHEVQRQQAQLDFMQAVASSPRLPAAESEPTMQMTLFGEMVPVANMKGGKRRK